MTSIPKFNFSGSTIKTDEELEQKLAETGNNGGKYFRPGKHTVTIASVEYQGPAKDDSWGKFLLKLEGTGEKSTTAQVIVPFKDVMYTAKSGKPTTYMFKRIQNFMKALGVELKISNLQDVLTAWFTNPSKTLVGKEVVVNIGYNGNHIAYDGKDSDGNAQFVIKMRDGSVQLDSKTLTPLLFSTRDAAMAMAESLNIEIQEYSSVLDYEVSPNAKGLSVAGW